MTNILVKECPDFIPLSDGTIQGDKKYCNLSFLCKQIDMYSEYVEIRDEDGNVIERDYLCTGKKIKKDEIDVDEKAT